jgi:hypothetical protein
MTSRRLYAALALLTLCVGCGPSGEGAAPAPGARATPAAVPPPATAAASAPAAKSPKAEAAKAFLVYYAKNVYALPEICQSQGVSLARYKARFIEVHARMLKVAGTLLDADKALAAARPEAMDAARRDLLDLATSDGKDTAFECGFIASNAVKIAESSDFSKTNAKTYAVMTQ